MPIFYFHIRNHDGLAIDKEGESFSDLATAQADAEESVREMIASEVTSGQPPTPDAAIEIADESGAVLATISFSSIMDCG